MVDLGLMYDNGNGIATDYGKAAFWYRRAAELGNSAGMVNLGYLYARGKGVEQNDGLAVAWYRRAVTEGNAAGMHNLAVMADGGRGMARDPEFAASLILQALQLHYEFSHRQMTEAARNWSRDFRRAVQKRLRDAGLFAGNLDGEFGDTTISAIDAYINRKR
jgi:TPR repeat protein